MWSLWVTYLSPDDSGEYFSEAPIGRAANPLTASLYGIFNRDIDALVITDDYETSPEGAHRPFEETQQLMATPDRKAIRRVLDDHGFRDERTKVLSNEKATRGNIMNAGQDLADRSVVFVQGHAQPRSIEQPLIVDNFHREYLTYDYHMSSPPRGLTFDKLSDIFIPPDDSDSTYRLLLSDFCVGHNFNQLEYVLELTTGETPRWKKSRFWKPSTTRDNNHVLVHLAAGSTNQMVHEANGGFFTQGFCSAMEMPRTLPDLLANVRNNVRDSMYKYGKDEKLQIPQLYSSFPFNLNDPNIMKIFGFFKGPTSPF